MSSQRMFTLSNLLEALLFDHPSPPNSDILTTRNSKSIQRNTNALMAKHCIKWESAYNIKGTVLGVTVLPFPGLGAIILLESGVQSNMKIYQIIINFFPRCSYHDFLNMAWRLLESEGSMSIVSASVPSLVTFAR
jgi:hypothetical protein